MAIHLIFVLTSLLVSHLSLVTAGPVVWRQANDTSADTNGALRPGGNYTNVCRQIGNRLSSSANVYYPGSPIYDWLNSHYAITSTLPSACVVEPASSRDVGLILDIVGRTRTPFAIKGGGHAVNQGFSSTKGVHISLNKLKSLNYNAGAQTVELGTGLNWGEVYPVLEAQGVSVVGGRANSVGVPGFTLGGGYSFKTNQYGLGLDTVTAFELVKPNGEITSVTQRSDAQLFFALRGASNNFGIVTKITVKTHPQGQVWGGNIIHADPAGKTAMRAATAKFCAQATDPKAAILSTAVYTQGLSLTSLQLFYDGPSPPAGVFDDFLNTPGAIQKDVSPRTYSNFVTSVTPNNNTYGSRGAFHTVPVPMAGYTTQFFELVGNITTSLGNQLTPQSLTNLLVIAEPFLPSILSHTASASAYPPSRSKLYTPMAIWIRWDDPAKDDIMRQAVRDISNQLTAALVAAGFRDVPQAVLYNNYAMFDTPLARIYGSSLPALKTVKRRVDPNDIMGLTGGWKVTV